jgi:hypothetical protein
MLIRESSVKSSFFGLRSVRGIFADRSVLINHVTGLNVPSFGSISDADLIACNIPNGAVVLIDEGHRLFPKRPSGADNPAYINWWAEHRHTGVDLYLVTQNPMDLDSAIRSRIDTHTHYVKAFGLRTMSYTWSGICDKPDNKSERKDAIKKAVSVDKSVFARYTSTTQDTTQRRVPAMLYWLPVLFLGVVVAGWYGISSVVGKGKPKPADSPLVSKPKPSDTVAAVGNQASAAVGKSVVAATVARSMPVIDYAKLTYSGMITSAGKVKRYYSLQADNGSSMPLEDVDLLAMGLTVTIVSNHPAVLLPDGTLRLIPSPSPSLSPDSGGTLLAGDTLGASTSKTVASDLAH